MSEVIDRLRWPGIEEVTGQPNPFQSGAPEDRRLRLTLDVIDPETDRQRTAVELLRAFGANVHLDVCTLRPDSDLPRVALHEEEGGEFFAFLEGRDDPTDAWHRREMGDAGELERGLQSLYSPTRMLYDATEEERTRHRQLVAHEALRRDIVVTARRELLDAQAAGGLEWVNLRTPEETCAIVGLYLRSHRDYEYFHAGVASLLTDVDGFYWAAARLALPSSWGFISSAAAGTDGTRSESFSLAWGVLSRYIRSLYARDQLGTLFYAGSEDAISAEAPEGMLYHFDYLTVLLVGAFDALARVVRVALRISGSPSNAGLRKKPFLQKVSDAGGTHIVAIVKDPHAAAVLSTLHKLRNTIHAAPLQEQVTLTASGSHASIMLAPADAETLFGPTADAGGMVAWGVTQRQQDRTVSVDPYMLARKLVEECGSLLDQLMAATFVDRTGAESIPGPLSNMKMFQSPFRSWLTLLADVPDREREQAPAG